MKLVNYKGLRLSTVTQPQFRHLLLLLYWIFYITAFFLLERGVKLNYHTIWCPLDDMIPFCELFVIPYFFWFVFIFWILLYAILYDVKAFKHFHIFAMITYTAAIIIYIIYPSQQLLRPEEYLKDNIFTDIAKLLHSYDTNTNVFPSIHIIGSMATLFTAWHSKRYSTKKWRVAFVIITVVICLSPLFLRQHSILDVAFGFVVSFAAYPFVFRRKKNNC